MKRLSHGEEMDLMLPISNMKNMKNFSDILPHFYYDRSTNQRVLQNMNALTKSFPDNFLDQKFELNSQFRSFYELEKNEENDPAYLTYARFLFDNCLHMKSWYTAFKDMGGIKESVHSTPRMPDRFEKDIFEKLEIAEQHNVLDYETFCNGKVMVGKDERKLFRFCLQNDLLTREQVDQLNTLKTKGGLYICMSRNPVDYLFVSTHQSFTSCLNLESEAEGCFWMGLGGLIVDASRFLTFVTSGRLLKYTVKGLEFKHFKYTSRSWGLMSKHEELCLVNAYPADKIRMRERLREAGYKVMSSSSNFAQSLLNYELPRHEDGSESTIYLDNVGISCRNIDKRKNKRTWYYTEDGTTGSLSEFDYDGTFENVQSFGDLSHEMATCDYCGERFHEDNGFYLESGGCICSYCYDEYHFTCRQCRSVYHNDDCKHHDDISYCSYCYSRYVRICSTCEETHLLTDSFNVEGSCYCPDCYDEQFFECTHCSNDILHEDCGPKGYGRYCMFCYNKLFGECTGCGCIEEHHTLTKYNGDELLCWCCVEKLNNEKGE